MTQPAPAIQDEDEGEDKNEDEDTEEAGNESSNGDHNNLGQVRRNLAGESQNSSAFNSKSNQRAFEQDYLVQGPNLIALTKVVSAASDKGKGRELGHTTSVPLPRTHVGTASSLGVAPGEASSALTVPVPEVPEQLMACQTSNAHFDLSLQGSSPESEVSDLVDGLPSMFSDHDGMDIDAVQSSTTKRKVRLSPGELGKLMRVFVSLLLIELPCC